MTQNAVVTKLLDERTAEVSVLRGTACGGSCGSCEACEYNSRILVRAENRVSAKPGDRVLVSTETSHIVGATFLIYVLPLIAFFLAYAVAYAAGLAQNGCILVSFLGLALGVVLSVVIGRRKKNIRYEISGYMR